MSTAEAAARRARLRTSAAGAVGLAGVGLIGTGLWARKDVQRVLTSERIVGPAGNGRPGVAISTAGGARSMAELIRRNTIEATGGRAYAEQASRDETGKALAFLEDAAPRGAAGEALLELANKLLHRNQ